jgi:hypothetical protein
MPPAYLSASLGLLALYLAAWLLWPRGRGGSLASAVLMTPFALLGGLFIPAYWQPDHVGTFLPGVGAEDFVFCFACGGLSWMAAGGAVRVGRPPPGPFLARAGLLLAAAAGGVALLRLVPGCGVMASFLVGFSACGGWLTWRLGRVGAAARAAAGFTAAYVLVAALVMRARPESAGFWVEPALLGPRVLGLPVEELAWAYGYGGAWPVLVEYCLGGPAIVRGRHSHPVPPAG